MTKGRELEFYYITPVKNLDSILRFGILSNDEVNRRGLDFKRISKEDIVEKRREKGLTSYANLYVSSRNAMMYMVLKMGWKIVVLGISGDILKLRGVLVSVGNAANDNSIRVPPSEIDFTKFLRLVRSVRDWISGASSVPIWKVFKRESAYRKRYYGYYMEPKKFLQSEILVPRRVPKKYIKAIYVPVNDLLREINLASGKLSVSVEPDMFFLPLRKVEIADGLYIVHGDMFISEMHTLTISVNTVGVMGKGLASRFKYMYPAAYVAYQDMVKSKLLVPGRPAFYMTEDRGFLFFPTKGHWREKSKLEVIEKGLKWFVKHYEEYGVKSIAFPALGCGLGGLKWKDVGPLMYHYLKNLKIPVEIYLPTNDVEEEYFKREFYERGSSSPLLHLP